MWTYEWLSTSISFHKPLPIYADLTYSTLRQLNIFITASVILYEPLPTSSPLSPKETHLTLVNHLTSFNLCQSMVTSLNLSEIGSDWITWEEIRFDQIESDEIKLYYIKYSFTGGSECDICRIGPLGQHRVEDEVLSQRTNMANITQRSFCKRVLRICTPVHVIFIFSERMNITQRGALHF